MAPPKVILVPTDFSETAQAALAYGKLLAKTFDASLHVLHILQSPFTYVQALEASAELAYLREQMGLDAGQRLEEVLKPDEKKALRARMTAPWGVPHVEIVDYATKHHVDLIVMGTHGRGPVRRMLMGRVAQRVAGAERLR